MHKEYPKYIFKATWMALVFSAEERALLPDWSDTAPEGFVCPSCAHFHGAEQVLAANLAPVSVPLVEDDDDEDEEDDEEDEEESVEENRVPGVSPRKTFLTDAERIMSKAETKRLRKERLAALRAKAEQ